MTLKDIILLATVFVLLVLSVIWYFIRKKKGKGCCGGCNNCPYSSSGCKNKDTDK